MSEPYYQDNKGIVLYLGDCLKVMPELTDQSIDAVICDPPYGTTACAWDTVIPFAPMWRELKRLSKPKAAVVLFGSQPFTSALVMGNPKWFRYEWVWEKSRPVNFVNAARRPLGAHENILIFSCGLQHTYNPQKWEPDSIYIDRRKSFDKLISNGNNYQGKLRLRHRDNGTRMPLSIIPVPSEWQEGMHPTQKPLALMEYLVKTYTNEGDTVLDFTCGSGTTLRACKNLGRRAIGIEIRQDYADITVNRLAPVFETALIDQTTDYGPLFAS